MDLWREGVIQFTPKVKSKSQGSKDSILVPENLAASSQTQELEGGSMGPQECLLQVLSN